MNTLIIIGIVFALLLAYILGGRAWLKNQPWAARFFAFIEPTEIFLFKKSETILWARFKILTGVLLTVLTQLGAIDLTPLLPFVPDKYEGLLLVFINFLPLIIAFVGMIDENLRNRTALPIELVAVAEKHMTPEVAEALAVAEVANVEAVVAVAVAKTEAK